MEEHSAEWWQGYNACCEEVKRTKLKRISYSEIIVPLDIWETIQYVEKEGRKVKFNEEFPINKYCPICGKPWIGKIIPSKDIDAIFYFQEMADCWCETERDCNKIVAIRTKPFKH